MSNNTPAPEQGTDPADTSENQAATRTYSQEEFDNAMARMKGTLQKKLLKPYEDLGDPEELRQLRVDADKRTQDQQLKRGEFETALQALAAKKDAEIARRDSIIREYKVNTPVLNAAAKFRAVNPDQVRSLLQHHLRLNQDGDVEIVDAGGAVRYNDAGQPHDVEHLVREFLDSNPHFVTATPATTYAQSTVRGGNTGTVDISKLDFKNPEHREVYRQYRKTAGIA